MAKWKFPPHIEASCCDPVCGCTGQTSANGYQVIVSGATIGQNPCTSAECDAIFLGTFTLTGGPCFWHFLGSSKTCTGAQNRELIINLFIQDDGAGNTEVIIRLISRTAGTGFQSQAAQYKKSFLGGTDCTAFSSENIPHDTDDTDGFCSDFTANVAVSLTSL